MPVTAPFTIILTDTHLSGEWARCGSPAYLPYGQITHAARE